MKKKILILCTTILMMLGIGISASAYTGTAYGNLYYEINDDNTAVTITDCNRSATEIIIPNEIEGLPVTSIGSEAFRNCDDLTSVTIPDSVTSIGSEAFYNCDSLTSVTIPDSVMSIGSDAFSGTALYNNTENWVDGVLYIGNHLIDVETSISGKYEIKAGTKTIANKAFYNCGNLSSITIPDSVTSIGANAFSCSMADHYGYYYYAYNNLETVYITDVAAWCETEFENESSNPLCNGAKLYINNAEASIITIPDGVESISNYAFYNCDNVLRVAIPDSVTSIGNRAFYHCDNLIKATVGAGVTSIGYRAFYDCGNLSSINIPDSVTSVGTSAFDNCNNLQNVYITDISKWLMTDFGSADANPCYYGANLYLNNELVTSVTVPENITSIKPYAFYNCDSLTDVKIHDNVTSVGKYAFGYCNGLTSINLPIGITSIENGTFRDCNKLAEINIPDGVTSIGDSAFNNCDSLIRVTIPEGVTSIGEDAFYDCDGLVSVGMPESVTSIGASAFEGCWKLTNIHIPNGVTSIGASAFKSCSSLETISIGRNVSSIGESAFASSGLKKVSIRTGVIMINSSWFSGCSKLETVEIPNTVIGILSDAFGSCSKLKEVHYTGTEAEWNDIAIATGNDYLINTAKVYNYTPYSIMWDKTVNSVNIIGDTGTYDVVFSDVNGKIIPVEVTFTEEGVKEVAMPDGMSTTGLKIFLWNSLEGMKPLADAITVN